VRETVQTDTGDDAPQGGLPDLLRLRNVSVGYGDLVVLREVSFSVAPNSCTAILGPNGVGKTTLIKAIAGALDIRSGQVSLEGVDMTERGTSARLKHVGWVPEGRLLFTDYTVLENMRLSARAAGSQQLLDESLEQVTTLFPVLKSKIHQRVGDLSGGQQQMVAMARALVRRPRLLLLDEPTMGLAPSLVGDIRRSLDVLRESGLSILISEQNVHWLNGLADSIVLLRRGLASVESADEFLGDREALRAAYLGG